MRYLLVERPQGLQPNNRSRIVFEGPTINELFEALHKRRTSRVVRESGCYYQYVEKDRYEMIDTWDEPGRIVEEPYWSYWEPGTYFPDDDNTALRFKAMELT